MKNHHFEDETEFKNFAYSKIEYQKWTPIFTRLGLKPRRFFRDGDEIFIGSAEGWFRLSLIKYDKQDLRWLRSVLEYLDERTFRNWAVPWRKSIIWEENSFCYLIQPWIFGGEGFRIDDPASIIRVVEVLANFHYCGKDYCESKGLPVLRDGWSKVLIDWEDSARKLDLFKDEMFHEKIRPEINDLRKEAGTILNEIINNWKNSGFNTLMEHHRRTGALGHGNLLGKNILWLQNDYYLLNWEHLAFHPRVKDLASLINDINLWEPEWILFFINEYAKIQPFWPEEYPALWGLLRYPQTVFESLETAQTEEFNRKNLKEVLKTLVKKERCLAKVWRELGTEKRWSFNQQANNPDALSGKVSMVLSPVEVWGNYITPIDSLIQIGGEHKLPPDILERLTHTCMSEDSNQVVGGRDGSVLDGSAGVSTGKAMNFNDTPDGKALNFNEPSDGKFFNFIDPPDGKTLKIDNAQDGKAFPAYAVQPKINEIKESLELPENVNNPAQILEISEQANTTAPEEVQLLTKEVSEAQNETPEINLPPAVIKENINKPSNEVIRWGSFPKTNGVR